MSRTACVSPSSPPAARVTPSLLTRTPAAPGARPAGSASVCRRAVTAMKTPPTPTSFVQQTSNARTASALPQGAIVTRMPRIQMTSVLQIKNARIASVWKKVTPPPHEDCVIILCPSGCDCDENLPNADDFCPNNYKCKQCQCLPAGEHQLTNQRSGHPADVQSKTGACHLRITNTVTQPPSCQVIHQASCVACQNHSQKDFSCKPKHTTGIRPL